MSKQVIYFCAKNIIRWKKVINLSTKLSFGNKLMTFMRWKQVINSCKNYYAAETFAQKNYEVEKIYSQVETSY